MKKIHTAELEAKEINLLVVGLETIKELETDRGILASGKEEIYGCIFGRDSLITSIKLLKAYQKTGDPYFLSLVRKVLANLSNLQGKEKNIESGEERGKIIHEYRERNHEHLTGRSEKPWYLYPEGVMKNYDSVDSTPLFLLAVSRYWELSRDDEFIESMMPSVELALDWLLSNVSKSEYGFVTYDFPEERTCGGLFTQSWMDSFDSVFHEDGERVMFPIAPVEAQGYAHVALRSWARHLKADKQLSWRLEHTAGRLKREFNKRFVRKSGEFSVAFAVDGVGKPMFSHRSSPGHLLWVSMLSEGHNDSILEPIFVPKLINMLMSPDLFEPEAGIRTLSKKSSKFDPQSYHNGSIWPHDNAIVTEGQEDFGYKVEADQVRASLRRAWRHFETPVELFVYNDGFYEYVSPMGQKACKNQAWSAASILSEL